MSNRQILASIKKRCIALRIETRELCQQSGVSPVTLWRWDKNPKQMTMAKVRTLEDKLSELEQKAKEGTV